MSPRWKKVAADALQHQGRLVMIWIAITAGVFAVAAIATAYSILNREVDAGYLATDPPSALIQVDRLDAAAVAGVRAYPGVARAEPGERLWARVAAGPGQWLPLLLFVAPDFSSARIGKIQLQSGRWPQDSSGILIERSALALARAVPGAWLTLQTPHGSPHALRIDGTVHDASLPPADQQQAVYGYVTPAAFAALGEPPGLHTLKVLVDDTAGEAAIVGATTWLRRAGYHVGEIRIPPRHHPHWSIMRNILTMLLAFSVLTTVLAAMLSATLLAGILEPQIRQLAVMKAIGASSGQILALYAALIAAICLAAVALGMPLGVSAGRTLSQFVAQGQNLDLPRRAISSGVLCGVMLAGGGIPLVLGLIPLWRAARRTVRESLSDHGVSEPARCPGFLATHITRFTGRSPAISLALRNCTRRKARVALSVSLLGVAGALFMASFNVLYAWRNNLADARIERHYDLEVEFGQQAATAHAIATALSARGVKRAEAFSDQAAALARADGLTITRTFPDGGHGSLRLTAVPPDSAFLTPVLTAGHWLRPQEPLTAVLNEQSLAFFPGVKPGDGIQLSVDGRNLRLEVAGIMREHLAGATVYTASDGILTRGLRIEFSDQTEAGATATAAHVAHALEQAGLRILNTVSRAQLGRALAGHLFVLLFILVAMSALMALVGVLGLASALTASVLERTREIAVLRAIGAGSVDIGLSVVAEGLIIAIVSAGLAAILSVPLTLIVAGVVGSASLGPALHAVISAGAWPLWILIVSVSAVCASALPAYAVSKISVREALIYQ